jgi:hypothetical protein
MRVNIILSLFIIFHFLSCNGNSQTISNTETDLQKENLKGKVILVVDDDEMKFYNIKGSLIKSSFFQASSGNQGYYSLNQFENSILKSTKTVYSSKEIGDIKTSYEYDSDGKLIISNSSQLFEYNTYDEKKRIKSRKSEFKEMKYNSITYYYYNNNGNLDSTIVEKTYNPSSNSEKNLIEINTYNQKSQLISRETFDSNNAERNDIIIYEYNENNDITKESFFNDNLAEFEFQYTFFYRYDRFGNWINSIYYNFGKDKYEVNRKIFYEGDDISEYEAKFNDLVAFVNQKRNPQNQNKSSSGQNNTYSNQNNSNISTQNKKKEVEWITCPDCAGRGFRLCMDCTGRGSMKCDYCYGRGWKNYGNEKQTCNTCGGTGEKTCKRCYGKGNLGTCICRGKGVVQKY